MSNPFQIKHFAADVIGPVYVDLWWSEFIHRIITFWSYTILGEKRVQSQK